MGKTKKQTQIKNKKKKGLSKGAKAGISLGCILPVLAGASAGIAIALTIPQGLVVEGGSTNLEYGNKADTKSWSLKDKKETYEADFEVVDAFTLEKEENASINDKGVVSWNKNILNSPGQKQLKVKATVKDGPAEGIYYSEPIILNRQKNPAIHSPEGIVAIEGAEGTATDKPFTLSSVVGVTESVKWSIDSEDACSINPDTGILSWPSSLLASKTHTMTITAIQGYYEVSANYTLNVTQDIHIVEKDGKTDFYNRTAAEEMFGNFSFVIRGATVTSGVTWKIYEGESSDESENFGMISLVTQGEYTIKILSSAVQSSNYQLKIVGSCDDPITKQTVTTESIVTYHGYTFNLTKPKIYGDASKTIESYQCVGTIQTPNGIVNIDPNKCQWTIDVSGLDDKIVAIDDDGKISIKENTTVHTDNSHTAWVNIERYEVSTSEFITVMHANKIDIQVGTPSLNGGKTEIELDEDGNYQASSEEEWSLKIDDFEIPSDVEYEIVDASASLGGKIEIGNSGAVKITGGEDGSFKVQASYGNISITTDAITVAQPEEEKYSIRSLPAGKYVYAAQGYGGGLQNNLVVYKGENPLSSDVKVTWSAKIEDGASGNVSIFTQKPDQENTGHMTWTTFTEEPSETDPVVYDITVTAKINGVQNTISETLHLQVVDSTKVISVDPKDTTWEVKVGTASDHIVPFLYNQAESGVVAPDQIKVDGSSSGVGFSAALYEEYKSIIVHYSGASLGMGVHSHSGTIEGRFYYYGSYVEYKAPFSITC